MKSMNVTRELDKRDKRIAELEQELAEEKAKPRLRRAKPGEKPYRSMDLDDTEVDLRAERDKLREACEEVVHAWDREVEGDLIDSAYARCVNALDDEESSYEPGQESKKPKAALGDGGGK